MAPRNSRGFTVMELIVALALSGIVVLGAALLLDQVNDSANRISREGISELQSGNGTRVLQHAFLTAYVEDSSDRFIGDERNVELSSWCGTPFGWSGRCRVRVSLDRRGDSSIVLLDQAPMTGMRLRAVAGMAEWRYLSASSLDSGWVRQWTSRIGVPAAIALLGPSDTAVFMVGVARD